METTGMNEDQQTNLVVRPSTHARGFELVVMEIWRYQTCFYGNSLHSHVNSRPLAHWTK